jgi:nitroreductase
MDTIFTRRSVRSFQDLPVEPEKIEKLLRAAMQAPSAANQQSEEFLVVQKRDALAQLSKMSPYAKTIARAPLAIVLLGNEDKMQFSENWQQDLGAAAENLLLEAVEQGLGAVWLGVFPADKRVEAIRSQFTLPENLMPFAVIAVGYPREDDANHFVDRWDETKVHYESI